MVERHVDGVLLVVELDVEAGDARVRIAAVGVEGLDALKIGVEPATGRNIPSCPTAGSSSAWSPSAFFSSLSSTALTPLNDELMDPRPCPRLQADAADTTPRTKAAHDEPNTRHTGGA